MNHSDSIVNLASAIVRAQAELLAVPENKQNPFLKSSYADLGAVIEAIRIPFEKQGLAIVQFPFGSEGEIGVETIVLHSSGEWISERASMKAGEEKGKTDAQVAGSIISYLRRYGISSVARIYTEDNDGQVGRVAGGSERKSSHSESGYGSKSDSGTTRATESQSRPTETRSHPPLSAVQRSKLVELWRNLHGTTEVDAVIELNKLFVEAFKNNMDAGTYEQGARITGQLLSQIRERPATKESAVSSQPSNETPQNGHTTNSKIKVGTCPTHKTETVYRTVNGKSGWAHRDGQNKWCYEVPKEETVKET